MAKVWKSVGRDVLVHWLEAIQEEASEKLNDWENRFIDHIAYQLTYKNELSQAQEEKLESIYAKYTS